MQQTERGYVFTVVWPATQLTDTVNGRRLEQAERAIRRRYREALGWRFIREGAPIEEEPRAFHGLHKVF